MKRGIIKGLRQGPQPRGPTDPSNPCPLSLRRFYAFYAPKIYFSIADPQILVKW